MGWVSELKWAVKGMLGSGKKPAKKNPATTPAPTPKADRVSKGLTNAGLSRDDIDRLSGKKRKASK